MHINPIHDNPPPAVLTPPDYMTIEQGLWRANAGQVVQELINNSSRLSKRIDGYQWRFNSARIDIENEIRNPNNPMFAATFAKSPVNTNFAKTAAYDWLVQNLPVQIITELPKDSQNAFYVTRNGTIATVAGNSKPSKALNFSWVIGPITYYALHKYTRNSGGQQGRQLEQEEKILTNFQQATDPNKVLIVIVDGDYYTDIRYINQRIGALRNLARGNTPKSFAVHIQHVPWAIAQCP